MKTIHLTDGLSFKSQLSDVSALVVVFLLTHSCGGQSQMVGPSQPIVAVVGDDIILPCHLEPGVDVVSRAVEWARPDLNPRFVHVRRDGVELLIDQNPFYLGRTSVSVDKLKCGDVSLRLSKVKVSDNGTYRCYVPELNEGSTVQLIVGVFSSPGVSITRDVSGAAVAVQCESAGWYPEPEVLWLDGEGKLLSAGPTETVRGPDDLYTVSSRVTVEKRHSNSFTCRVQQKDIGLTRQTHVRVADDVLVVPSYLAVRVSISLAACFISVLTVIVTVTRCGLNKSGVHHVDETEPGRREKMTTCGTERDFMTEGTNRDKLMGEERDRVDSSEEPNTNLDGGLLRGHLELVQGVIETLEDQRTDLTEQRDTLKLRQQEVQKQIEDTVKKLEHPAEFRREKKQKKLLAVKQDLERRQTEDQRLIENTETLLETTQDMIDKMTQLKEKLEKDKKQTDT